MVLLDIWCDGQHLTEVEIARSRLTIGREHCHVNLADPRVSETHCIIEKNGRTFTITDTSRNGVTVGGVAIEPGEPHPLPLRTPIEFADYALTLRLPARVPSRRTAATTVEDKAEAPDLFGVSAVMQEVRRTLSRLASARCVVLLTGEPGVGKTMAAQAMHRRRTGPFVQLNVATLRGDLAGSELFGHERGAFTGADARREGAFHAAEGGTLFLDEIGELQPDVATMLLRVLEEGTVRRVGSTQSERVDVRVVAATNRDLPEMVRRGTFRQDLYDRLNGFPVHLPPLRERPEDIPMLAEAVLRRHHPGVALTPEAVARLTGQPWPANVRGLRNVLDRAVVLAEDPRLLDDAAIVAALTMGRARDVVPAPPRRRLPPTAHEIRRALRKGKTQRDAAALLGISRGSLRYWMRKRGIPGSSAA